ncbi:hypothetical protein V6N12_001556 [Hibiscus sabdariffa]|uniref:Uncharacterized protein n=1 Tax=Hibiscus sabdariffa TaxID=183260 RepID=A0ABR2AUA1_9ROSI
MVERDHEGEDVAIKNCEVMEDESMDINGSLHVLQPSPKIKSKLKGEGVRETDKQVTGQVIHITREFDF